MFMEIVRSEVFGAQQRNEHVDRHARGRGDVKDGDKHGLHAPQQDGIDRKQREHDRAGGDEDEIHGIGSDFWSRSFILLAHQGSAPMSGRPHKRVIKSAAVALRRLGEPQGTTVMEKPTRILLQTTIPFTEDDWHIGRFSRLRDLLAAELGFAVTARDRDPLGAPDSVLSTLDTSDFDQLWLFAVDVGDGLTAEDCAAVSRFRKRGGGMMVTRDHMDLGSSVCTLGGLGAAHFFHSKNPDPDPARNKADDIGTPAILWPNYHSGANGDFQAIGVEGPVHPVLADPAAPGGAIRYLPSHPHEGAVGKPASDPTARVIATGTSQTTGAHFNIAVAFEPSTDGGPAIAQSTFHHFADYNWDPSMGAPSFVSEPPGGALAGSPEAQRSIRLYARNLARWLAGRPTG
jgi:hypothetical protein